MLWPLNRRKASPGNYPYRARRWDSGFAEKEEWLVEYRGEIFGSMIAPIGYPPRLMHMGVSKEEAFRLAAYYNAGKHLECFNRK